MAYYIFPSVTTNNSPGANSWYNIKTNCWTELVVKIFIESPKLIFFFIICFLFVLGAYPVHLPYSLNEMPTQCFCICPTHWAHLKATSSTGLSQNLWVERTNTIRTHSASSKKVTSPRRWYQKSLPSYTQRDKKRWHKDCDKI